MKPLISLCTVLLAASPAIAVETPRRAVSKAPLHTLVSSDDYPAAALEANEQGTVRFRLDVDEAGRVANCTIVMSSGSASLDETTCAIMRSRAEFTPAADAEGNAVPDSHITNVRWALEAVVPGLDEARSQVMQCAIPRASSLMRRSPPSEKLADRALDGCRGREARMVEVMQAARAVKLGDDEARAEARRDNRAVLLMLMELIMSGNRQLRGEN